MDLLRLMKNTAAETADWFLYKFLKTGQKQYLANLLTKKQKQQIKKLIKPGKKQTQVKKMRRAKFRLYDLGFTEKGYHDLHALYAQHEDAYLKRQAAWELAVYHANQYSKADAKQCLHYIEQAIHDEEDTSVLRRAAVLQAESHALLGEMGEAERVLTHALASKKHADLYLAYASITPSLKEKMKWINRAYALHGVTGIQLKEAGERSAYDCLQAATDGLIYNNLEQAPIVSIIIPVYNAAGTVQTALNAIRNQTWMNIEIIVVDDCSTDDTKEVVEGFVLVDDRISIVSTKTNSGAYTARNEALRIATGEFVTINDADDWSHPEKIKTQAEHLMNNPKTIGNFSQQARATEELTFYRRGKPGIYIFPNMSSFMFRRKPVMEKLGHWDSVRFAGDSEFMKRIKLVFGEKAVAYLKTAPLSFQRQSVDSLTGDSAFGFPGYFMGARKEYAEAHDYYHETHPDGLYYSFPQEERPFPVPAPMLPQRDNPTERRRHFDVIIASEFRLTGGTNMSNIEEIKAQKKHGLTTGLVQMSRYDLNSVTAMNPKVRACIDGETVQAIVYGEKVSCDVLIVRHPPVLQERQKYIPDIQANHVRVIINQPPKREYSETGETLYDIPTCAERLEAYTGKRGIWYPIGPSIRDTLYENHARELEAITLADEDWVNIIDVAEWQRAERPQHERIVIGRHSRDQYVKWPADREELLAIYPDTSPYAIHVLGGAKAAEKVLGELPENWKVQEFGKVPPREFLASLDVFVYYTHPEWVEAFGRVIFEAMAAGVPVIIPPHYQPLFGEAAIYAEPYEVQDKIMELMNDDSAYQAQVEKACNYVEQHFGYLKHVSRLEECLHAGR